MHMKGSKLARRRTLQIAAEHYSQNPGTRYETMTAYMQWSTAETHTPGRSCAGVTRKDLRPGVGTVYQLNRKDECGERFLLSMAGAEEP
jgi:hypothetical protein